MTQIHRYSFPTDIFFGAGAISLAPELLQKNGFSRPLILTDTMMAEFELIKSLKARLNNVGLTTNVSAPVFGNPDSTQVKQGVADFHSHNADSIIAIGGGAALDVAKAVALMAYHDGTIFDYEDGKSTREIKYQIPFVIAIPTTAGTGSEVGRSTVISDPVTHEKKIIFDPRLLAKIVLADPELTLQLPAHLTAATGMDALTHLVESFLAKGSHPMCEGIALEGLRLTARSLKKCFDYAQEGAPHSAEHLGVRTDMMHAAMMGAVAFQKGLGVNHSCAHALSTVTNMHHGLANAIMLPFCMRFNFNGCEEQFGRLAQAVGLQNEIDFIQWLIKLRSDIHIPANLSDARFNSDKIRDLVEVAFKDGCHASNPKPVSKSDLQGIFTSAFSAESLC